MESPQLAQPEIQPELQPVKPPQEDATESVRSATFRTFFEITSIHALQDWAQASSFWAKTFWMTLFCVCFGIGTWQVTLLAMEYSEEPHFIGHVESNYELEAKFPRIVVCNEISFLIKNKIKGTNKQIKKFDSALEALLLILEINSAKIKCENTLTGFIAAWKEFPKIAKQIYNSTDKIDFTNPSEVFAEFGMRCNEIMKKCYWKKKEINCCEFVHPIFKQNGLCFEFILPQKNQDTPGAGNGLSLLMSTTQQNAYVRQSTDENDRRLATGMSLEIAYEQRSTIVSNPIGLADGTYNWISMKKKVTKYDESTVFQRNCVEPEQIEFKFIDGLYTQANCDMECNQEVMHKVCGCTFAGQVKGQQWEKSGHRFIPHNKLYRTCNPNDIIECYYKGIENHERAIRKCEEKCVHPCSEFNHVEITQTNVPLKRSVETPKGSIFVNIYFPDRSYQRTLIREKSTLFEFMAEMGGHFGLWLGVSVISLIQALYYLGAYILNVEVEPPQLRNPDAVMPYVHPDRDHPTNEEHAALINTLALLQNQLEEMKADEAEKEKHAKHEGSIFDFIVPVKDDKPGEGEVAEKPKSVPESGSKKGPDSGSKKVRGSGSKKGSLRSVEPTIFQRLSNAFQAFRYSHAIVPNKDFKTDDPVKLDKQAAEVAKVNKGEVKTAENATIEQPAPSSEDGI